MRRKLEQHQGLLDEPAEMSESDFLESVARMAFRKGGGLLGELLNPPETGPDQGYIDDQGRLVVTDPLVRESNFRHWFGDSKVVDAEGKPLVMYHGTNDDFDEFSQQKTAYGYYFTPDPNTAAYYGETLMPVNLKAENILDLTDETVRSSFFNEAFGSGRKVPFKFNENFGTYDEADDYDAIRIVSENYQGNESGWQKLIPILQNLEEGETIEDALDYDAFGWDELNKIAEQNPNLKKIIDQQYLLFDPDVKNVEDAYGGQDFYMNYQDDMLRFAESQGYDAVIFDDPSSTGESKSHVIFNPLNIKSTKNRGTYNPDDPDIYSMNMMKKGLLYG